MVTSNIKKLLHVLEPGGEPVVRQAVEEHLAVTLAGDAVVEQGQHAAVGLAANQAPEALLQGDRSLRNLIVVKGIPFRFANALNPRVGDRIVGYCEWQLVYDNAAQLLARHVHVLSEGRGGEQDAVGRGAELIEQPAPRA